MVSTWKYGLIWWANTCQMWDLFYSWRSNLVMNILAIVGFTLLMMIWKWFSFIWLSAGFCRSLWPWSHKDIVLVCFEEVWSKKTNSHTWNEKLWVSMECGTRLSVSWMLCTEFFHFHWGWICGPKVWLLPIFTYIVATNVSYLVWTFFLVPWKVDSCLGHRAGRVDHPVLWEGQ